MRWHSTWHTCGFFRTLFSVLNQRRELLILTMQEDDYEINQHYGRGDLGTTILAALQAAGKNPQRLTPDDLAPVDQFHTAGKQATLELMHLAELQAGMEVLDVGGGLGGAARLLAAEQGCKVTVLDLTQEYCRVGELLTARTGLSDRVSFQQGSALDMPFPEARFDVVWTQHSSMNIADKARLYAEVRRVLRPAGRLAFHEIMAGPVQPIHFPVPWAHEPAISFLRPPVGLHLLLGPRFGEMFGNQVRNLQEHRITVIQAVFERI